MCVILDFCFEVLSIWKVAEKKEMIIFHTAYHIQANRNGGSHASFQDIAVYSCTPFTQLTQFICNEIVRFLHLFVCGWVGGWGWGGGGGGKNI